MSAKKILLVDDDVAFIEGVKALLETEGYEVYLAHDGESGVATAKQVLPHLMILDVMMTSDTEGFDVSRRIQDQPDLKGLPVIMMTGIKKAMNLPFGFEPDAEWLPVRAVLEKPVPPDVLLAEVKKQLDV